MSCVSIHSRVLLDLYKVAHCRTDLLREKKVSIIYEHIPSPRLIVYFLHNCFDVTKDTYRSRLNDEYYTLTL